MKLTPNFTLAELTKSDTARQRGLSNMPSGVYLDNLRTTAQNLEIMREILGNVPIRITSAYRSPAVNSAVGGVPNSDHMLGWAADFTAGTLSPYLTVAIIVDSSLAFDQIIHEKRRWVHISFHPRMRREVKTLPPNSKRYLNGLHL